MNALIPQLLSGAPNLGIILIAIYMLWKKLVAIENRVVRLETKMNFVQFPHHKE